MSVPGSRYTPAMQDPPVQAIVVAVGGLVASGKSTLARRLAQGLGAELLSGDAVRAELLRQGAAPALEPGFAPAVYEELLRRAGPLLDAGRRVVLDAAFPTRSARSAARRLAREREVPFRFVECRAPVSVCRERLRARGGSEARGGWLALFESVARSWEPADELPPHEHLVVDTSGPLDALPELALDLGSGAAAGAP
jgi:predicted kinase